MPSWGLHLPELSPIEEAAIDVVVGVVNKAQFKIGNRQNLFQLANSRNIFNQAKINLTTLRPPLGINSEELIADAIQRKWKLMDALMYVLEYKETTQDESTQFYYYEAIFSQPTAAYPIPQATCSVYFRVEDTHTNPAEIRKIPMMWFRIEGHNTEYDVRYVQLSVDWILAVIKMKIKLFQRIEELRIF